MAEHKSLATDLFEDMGRKVAEASAQQDEDDSRVVDEIESLCMNCHENVRPPKATELIRS
jgi:zinc finger protein